MKHILPILTITTLAAAASAQTAASSGLSYNRVGLSYDTQTTTGYSLEASAVVGGNYLIEAATTIGGNAGNGADSVSVGYIFKNVAAGIDATLSIGSNESYGLNLRKDLGSNFEGAVSYSREQGNNVWGVEVQYNLNKQFGLALGYADSNAVGVSSQTTVSVRYNF